MRTEAPQPACSQGLRRGHAWQRPQTPCRRSQQASRPVRGPVLCQAQQQQQQQQGASSPLAFLCPLLKLLGGGDAAAPRQRWLEVLTSGLASVSRLPYGTSVAAASAQRTRRPEQPLLLYEFEACPFCRRVREAIADLDLENVRVRPCPKDSAVHRGEALARGGRAQFPFLVDPNTAVELYESDAIVRHLYATYGAPGQQPPPLLLQSTLLTGWMPTLLRAGRGMVRHPGSRPGPPQELRLFSYEGNQFARLVREALCELELPYELVSVAKGSRRRGELRELAPEASVPFLVDANTGTSLGESEAVVAYLFRTYAGAA